MRQKTGEQKLSNRFKMNEILYLTKIKLKKIFKIKKS